MDGYIRDGIAPLKRYLSTGSTSTHTINTSKQYNSISTFWDSNDADANSKIRRNSDTYGDAMDWGIENLDEIDGSNTEISHNDHDISSPTLINEFPNYSNHGDDQMSRDNDFDGMTPHIDDKFYDWGISPKKNANNNLGKSTLRNIFDELMKLNHEQHLKNLEFLDEFRYTVITSQLLDQTILVSKFQQMKKQSSSKLLKHNKTFYKNGLLISLNQNFHIQSFLCPFNIVNILGVLSHLQKHKGNYQNSQIRLVIIISLIILNAHTISHTQSLDLIQHKTLNQLKRFIKIQQKFDLQEQKLITKYKELKLYNNILPIQQQHSSEDPSQLFDLVSSTIIVASTSVINSIHKILPYVNGYELENYCELYNIELTQLGFETENLKPFNISESESSIDQLVNKFRRFQYLRRFLIVLFLAMNHQFSTHSPFLMKVFGIFQIKSRLTCSILKSSVLVSQSLESLQELISGLVESLSQFRTISDNKVEFIEPSSPSVDQLMNKIKEFELQLIVLRRDHSPQQLEEAGQTLSSLQQLYQREIRQFQAPKQRSVSTPSSLSIEKRKRFSLPNASNYSNLQIQQSPQRSQRPKTTPHKHYKRLSTGFALPLLTVTEEDEGSKRAVSYDDNYLNIMPTYNTFNSDEDSNQIQPQISQINQHYIQDNNLLSNDDSVIFTSNGNNEEDDKDDEEVDSEEFKRKLELNFAKMINGNSNQGSDDTNDDDKNDDDNDEVNLNNEKIDTQQGVNLMDELKMSFNKK
ncbi:Inheritance of peroxisomes protein 2 [Wickerhamomyces ciferrii]|uniref:Inheritance of peroxisomes protein 2 n=1 Tax=Wickerhamomyces ciferrii (strain ATCC 14091 / BCRC 22168 / CBS 111 / JCM 3599 / NBRC 0793 / NRRL Y-1031 F-60-10) TaxID=1206466 RepID=K0KC28_WICCF|nr:Inheritance of peroxisomes protein 2 [Wickerhamomyces ciferrii]CCH42630.1 Inheritance of peroxisomes protein 2 [Wickerhamomyces ciferrii]